MTSFSWRDGDRLIRFGRGAAGEAVDVLGGPGYTLLTTERATGAAPHVAVAANEVTIVVGGAVPDLAGDLQQPAHTRAAVVGLAQRHQQVEFGFRVFRQARRPQRADIVPLLVTAFGVVVGFPLLTALALPHIPAAN